VHLLPSSFLALSQSLISPNFLLKNDRIRREICGGSSSSSVAVAKSTRDHFYCSRKIHKMNLSFFGESIALKYLLRFSDLTQTV